MSYLYYPGCSTDATGKAYDASARAVMERLGEPLVEIDDWNCCGATSYFSVREIDSFAIAARNLSLAQQQGEEDVCVICNACYTSLAKVNRYMTDSKDVYQQVNGALKATGRSYNGRKPVRHMMDILKNDIGFDAIAEQVVQPLKGIKVASYYGCQFSRPQATFDSAEDPSSLDDLCAALGAEPLRDYPTKMRCCGGMMMLTQPDASQRLCHEILKAAKDMGADVIIAACPLCEMNLEAYQGDINKALGTDYQIPIMYFTQLLGLALGIGAKELAIDTQLVSCEPVLAALAENAAAEVMS